MRAYLIAFMALAAPLGAFAQTPITPWTGAYGGINFGLGGHKFTYPGNGQVPEGAIGSDNTVNTSSGFLGGAQLGYQWQFNNQLVIGAETDFQWSSIAANYSRVDLRNDYEWDLRKTQLLYFGTLRARMGYAFGPVLPYLTGGLAYGRTSAYDEEGGDIQTNGTFEPTTIGRAASIKWGWTVGAGVEYAIDQRFRVKAEYLVVDLGHMWAIDHAGSPFRLSTRANIMRVGLNYAFGDPIQQKPAVSIPYTQNITLKDWTGFHVGANFGLGGNGVSIAYLEAGEGTRRMNSFGFLGGVEAGYDRQFSNQIVIGGVLDWQLTSISAYRKKIEPPAEPEPGVIDIAGTNGLKYRILNLGNLRARIGYSMGSFLPYVTAGFAMGQTKFNQYDPSDIVSTQQTRTRQQTGFTAGAGFEYAIASSWTFKADYLYYNLGQFTGFEVDLDEFKTKISFSTVRAGLTYRF